MKKNLIWMIAAEFIALAIAAISLAYQNIEGILHAVNSMIAFFDNVPILNLIVRSFPLWYLIFLPLAIANDAGIIGYLVGKNAFWYNIASLILYAVLTIGLLAITSPVISQGGTGSIGAGVLLFFSGTTIGLGTLVNCLIAIVMYRRIYCQ